jgi:hypothetical protein
MQTWQEFRSRFSCTEDFYAVIDPDGHWCDSSESFSTAAHWALMDSGLYNVDLSDYANFKKLDYAGYSVINSKFLFPLWKAGAIK